MRTLLLLVLAFGVAAPAAAQQLVPPAAERMQPPAEYATWWAEAVAVCDCEPASPYSWINWYVVPGATFFDCTETPLGCYGRWIMAGDVHFIILTSVGARERGRVLHEMLHSILATKVHTREFQRLSRLLVADR